MPDRRGDFDLRSKSPNRILQEAEFDMRYTGNDSGRPARSDTRASIHPVGGTRPMYVAAARGGVHRPVDVPRP